MPALTISAPLPLFQDAVQSLCFHGGRLPESDLSIEEFAIAELKRLIGNCIREHKQHVLEQQVDATRQQILAAIEASGDSVTVTITPDPE